MKITSLQTPMLNRAAVTVIPKQPYIEWANALEEGGPKIDPKAPSSEYTVYLINEVDDEMDFQRALRRHCRFIFEHELAGWHRDEEGWPQERDYRTFEQWFEVQFSSVVVDLSKHPHIVEEFGA